jgi:hypothetical protein
VVANCDHLCFFFRGQLEHEVRREPSRVALYLLVESLFFHPIKFRKVGVNHDPLASYGKDSRGNGSRDNEIFLTGHALLLLNIYFRLGNYSGFSGASH